MSQESRTEQLMARIRSNTGEEIRGILEKAEKIREERFTAQEAWEKREEKSWKKKEKTFSRELESRLEASFRMDRKRLFLQSQEQLIQRIEEEAMHRIEDSMAAPWYRESLKEWIVEGILGLREETLLLKGSVKDLEQMDESLLESVREEVRSRTGLTVDLQVRRDPPELVPGVLLESPDGRVSFNNQLPARFRRMKAGIRQVIHNALKEQAARDE